MSRRYYSNKGVSPYSVVTTLSYFYRTFYLPNPFENYEWGLIINMVAGVILWRITYKTVGLFYRSGQFPVFGSIMYLILYFINTEILVFMSRLDFGVIPVAIICGVYIVMIRFVYERLMIQV